MHYDKKWKRYVYDGDDLAKLMTKDPELFELVKSFKEKEKS
jgi:hypothetical protein